VAATEAGRLQWLLTAPVPKPTLDPGQRRRLETLLRPEAERMRDLAPELALDDWTIWSR
jgi:hypothetical protein